MPDNLGRLRTAITSADHVTVEWLTEILEAADALTGGRIVDVTIVSSQLTLVSTLVSLRVGYSGEGTVGPTRLLLKSSRPESGVDYEGGRNEVDFYARLAPLTPPDLLPRCYDTVLEPETGRFHVLMDDLSETHYQVTEWPIPPTTGQCERIVATYARLHGAWWNDSQLGGALAGKFDEARAARFATEYARRFSDFADRLGDRLPDARRRIFERVIEAEPSRPVSPGDEFDACSR